MDEQLVFWVGAAMNTIKRNAPLLLFCGVISLFFLYPYLISNQLNLEHDTFFHLSRIEGLAQSIQEGIWFPHIYPYKNAGFGYGSPLFYSDFFLMIPALFYLAQVPITICYKLLLLGSSFFSALAMAICIKRISRSPFAPYLGAFLYLFSTYRITDVYVRGAMGEVMAFVFLPFVLLAAFELFNTQYHKAFISLVIGFSGLILTHNITFLLGCLLFAGYLLLNIRTVLKQRSILFTILAAMLSVFALTAFFTFPMIEQMLDHTMIVHYYSGIYDLSSYALAAWQFFINDTIFGFAGNSNPSADMVTNAGWFLTFVPLILLLVIPSKKTDEERFTKQSMLLGYFFLILCSGVIPWDSLQFLGVIQFPWRFMTIAIAALCLPAAQALFLFFKKESLVFSIALCFLVANGIWQLQPVLSRTFVIQDEAPYSDITNGTITDPYYSADYMRVELAAGDYLPWPHVDFRGYAPCLRTLDQTILSCEIQQQSTTLLVELEKGTKNQDLLAPLTYYKGYQAYHRNEQGILTALATKLDSSTGLVSFNTQNTDSGTYLVRYTGTPLQKISGAISSLTALAFGLCIFQKKLRKDKSNENYDDYRRHGWLRKSTR